MDSPTVTSAAEWQAALDDLRAKEKAHTRAGDALAAQRRRLPRVPFDATYVFDGPRGPASLLDLFEGRTQLIVYHFMLEPGGEPCTGCSMVGDNVPELAHVHARDTTLAFVSRAPRTELEPFRRRMGWKVPWYSADGNGFPEDCGIGEGFGLSVFLRDGADVLRTYFTTGRGVEVLGTPWSYLDLTPLGRQETWEDSPAGTPQTERATWWRLHDEYPEEL